MNKAMEMVAREAVAGHLAKNGYEILDTDFMGFIVMNDLDYDELAFCKFSAEIGHFPELTPCERREFEEAIVAWVISHEVDSMGLRRDEIICDVCKSDGAVIRHHINCC